jgi:hypothetical protein
MPMNIPKAAYTHIWPFESFRVRLEGAGEGNRPLALELVATPEHWSEILLNK